MRKRQDSMPKNSKTNIILTSMARPIGGKDLLLGSRNCSKMAKGDKMRTWRSTNRPKELASLDKNPLWECSLNKMEAKGINMRKIAWVWALLRIPTKWAKPKKIETSYWGTSYSNWLKTPRKLERIMTLFLCTYVYQYGQKKRNFKIFS